MVWSFTVCFTWTLPSSSNIENRRTAPCSWFCLQDSMAVNEATGESYGSNYIVHRWIPLSKIHLCKKYMHRDWNLDTWSFWMIQQITLYMAYAAAFSTTSGGYIFVNMEISVLNISSLFARSIAWLWGWCEEKKRKNDKEGKHRERKRRTKRRRSKSTKEEEEGDRMKKQTLTLNQQASYKLSQIACLGLNDRLHT